MKRILTLLLVLLPLVGCAQSDLYHRYASLAGTTVAQVSGFKLNDSVRIDVVMVQSDSDKDWHMLAERFGIADSTGVTSWLGDAQHPEQRTRWEGKPVVRVVASSGRRTIGLYCLKDERQYDALIDYQMRNMKK